MNNSDAILTHGRHTYGHAQTWTADEYAALPDPESPEGLRRFLNRQGAILVATAITHDALVEENQDENDHHLGLAIETLEGSMDNLMDDIDDLRGELELTPINWGTWDFQINPAYDTLMESTVYGAINKLPRTEETSDLIEGLNQLLPN